MQVDPEAIVMLQIYYKKITDNTTANKVTTIAPVREVETITIVRTLDMLGIEIPGINCPDE